MGTQRCKPYNKRKAWATKRNNTTSKFNFGGEVKFGGNSAFVAMPVSESRSRSRFFEYIKQLFRNLVRGNR